MQNSLAGLRRINEHRLPAGKRAQDINRSNKKTRCTSGPAGK